MLSKEIRDEACARLRRRAEAVESFAFDRIVRQRFTLDAIQRGLPRAPSLRGSARIWMKRLHRLQSTVFRRVARPRPPAYAEAMSRTHGRRVARWHG